MLSTIPPMLFAIDFDLTLTTVHIHNMLSQAILVGIVQKNDIEAQWQYVKHVLPTGTAVDWLRVITQLQNDGHYVAIASFGEFPLIIDRYLKEIIGVNDVFVESWLPEHLDQADKGQHIRNIMHHYQLDHLPPEKIVLVDDAEPNLRAAKAAGNRIVPVLPGDKLGKHLEAMAALSKQGKIQ